MDDVVNRFAKELADAIAAAVSAFEAQSTGTPQPDAPSGSVPAGDGPGDAGGGPDQAGGNGPQAGFSRHVLIEALARFRLATDEATGETMMDGAPVAFAGMAGSAGVGLAVPGMSPGTNGALTVLSGLTEGFLRL